MVIMMVGRKVGRPVAVLDSLADEDLGTLVQMLGSRSSAVRMLARERLVSAGAAAIAPLSEALDSRDFAVRWEAVKALGEFYDPAAAAGLVRGLVDEDFGVRWLAAEGLVRLGFPGLLASLRALELGAQSVWLRSRVHQILHAFARQGYGPELAPVLRALEGWYPQTTAPLAAARALEALTAADSGRTRRLDRPLAA
jgi:HEAT repeat protein